MVGWHHRLNGHEFEQTPGDSEGQGTLSCGSQWGHKKLDRTYQLNNNSNHHQYIERYHCSGICSLVLLSRQSTPHAWPQATTKVLRGSLLSRNLPLKLALASASLYFDHHLLSSVNPLKFGIPHLTLYLKKCN